jgi:hypothetical protein
MIAKTIACAFYFVTLFGKNKGYRRGDFLTLRSVKCAENPFACGLCFVTKYDKIEAHRKAVFK